MDVLWWAVLAVCVWLAFIDPWVVEPWQRRRAARKARAFDVGVGPDRVRVR